MAAESYEKTWKIKREFLTKQYTTS
ncbi:DUF4113 domain-containing protein [Mucilaginibacter polytrichastri]